MRRAAFTYYQNTHTYTHGTNTCVNKLSEKCYCEENIFRDNQIKMPV